MGHFDKWRLLREGLESKYFPNKKPEQRILDKIWGMSQEAAAETTSLKEDLEYVKKYYAELVELLKYRL